VQDRVGLSRGVHRKIFRGELLGEEMYETTSLHVAKLAHCFRALSEPAAILRGTAHQHL
jgi:hypothetical protein